jgi:hypothetical protein
MALGDGETTVYCSRLGQWSLEGDQSRLTDYLTVADRCDAKHALQMFISTIRTQCRNTLNLGLRNASVKFNLRHVAGHRVAYGAAVDEILKSQNKVREVMVRLTKVQYDQERLRRYLAIVFEKPENTGDNPQLKAVTRQMEELRDEAERRTMKMVREEGCAFNGWAAANGASEAIEHGGIMPKLSTRMGLALGTGRSTELVARAFAMAERV